MVESLEEDGWFYLKLLLVLGGCLVFAHFLEQWLRVEVARCISYFFIPLCNYRFLGAHRQITFWRWSFLVTIVTALLIVLKVIGYYIVVLRLSI